MKSLATVTCNPAIPTVPASGFSAQWTCFVLTALGMRLVASRGLGLVKTCSDEMAGTMSAPPLPAENARCLPSWDNQRRILCVGEQVVKKYRVPSLCQQAILEAFQEEGWPPVIDNPFLPPPEQDQKRRLRDTIKSLNLSQVNAIVRFRGDGSGTAPVLWELRNPGSEMPKISVRGGCRTASARWSAEFLPSSPLDRCRWPPADLGHFAQVMKVVTAARKGTRGTT